MELSPQQTTEPPVGMAQVWSSPAATATTEDGDGVGMGVTVGGALGVCVGTGALVDGDTDGVDDAKGVGAGLPGDSDG